MPSRPARARPRRLCALWAVCALLLGAGCGGAGAGASDKAPESALRRYVAAVESGDARAAYALLDEATRREVPFEEFRRLMQENQAELQDQADALGERIEQGVPAHARVPLEPEGELLLVLEDGRWRVEGGVFDAPVLRTPRDAVLALRRALQQRDLRSVERVLSRETRSEVEAEIERFLEETEDELDLAYEIRGNRAVVRTTSGRQIVLEREAGEWRVVEVR